MVNTALANAHATPWQVVAAHSDPAARARCAEVVASMPRLALASEPPDGPTTVLELGRGVCDLLILDLDLDGIDCLRLIRRLRASATAVEIILVAQTGSASTVRRTLHAGALDYLLKPLDSERLRRALGMFLARASALRADELDQEVIDRAYGAGRLPRRWLPKGLSAGSVTTVRELLSGGVTFSAADAARITGLSRVTVRRYLEYLVATRQAVCTTVPAGRGRPRKLYRTASC